MKSKNIFLTSLPYVSLMLISILLTGISELASAKFDFTYLSTANYWSNMILTNISAFLMAISTTFMVRDAIESKTEEGLGKEAKELNEVVTLGTAKINNDVDIMISEENTKRKKQAWNIKIKRKMYKIERKFTEKDSYEYSEYLQLEDKESFDLDKARRRVYKKIKLERLLSEEFLEKRLIYLKVRYKRITRRMIENGQDGGEEENTALAKNGLVLMKGILPKFLYSTSITMFILSFRYELATFTITALIPLFTKLITLLLNANFGKNFAPSYFKDTTIFNLKLRKEWITKYFDWRNEKRA